MKISEINCIYYSATGTSRSIAMGVADSISKTMSAPTKLVDLTFESQSLAATDDQLTIIACPVYAGHIAPKAMERLSHIKSTVNGAAVLIAVYGNRDYEGALIELYDTARQQGFNPIAIAAFIGEHSYSTPQRPIAPNRPDPEDLKGCMTFGRYIASKVATSSRLTGLTPLQVQNLPRPKPSPLPYLGFVASVIKLKITKPEKPTSPSQNNNLCTQCGQCLTSCPTQAIKLDPTPKTDSTLCTRCCACVKVCAVGARSFDPPMAPLLARYFKKRNIPQWLVTF